MRAYSRFFLIVNVLVALPLILKMPFWLTLLYALVMFWHGLALSGRLSEPSRLIKLALVVAAITGFSVHFGNLLRIEVWICFIVFFVGVVLTSPTKNWHVFLNVVLNWFVILGSVLSWPGALTFLHMIVSLLLTSSHLYALAACFRERPVVIFKRTAWYYAQGLPIFILIALLFPSLSEQAGLFWQIPGEGLVGFSDQLLPGRILRLGSDDKVAFRVSFIKGLSPAPQNMYWRGTVLWDTDGINWFNEYDAPLSPEPEKSPGAQDIVQRITLEPKKNPALFALESPKAIRILDPEFQNTVPLAHSQFAYFAEPNMRLVYEARSVIEELKDVPDLSPSLRNKALEVPADVGPSVIKLIQNWKDSSHSNEDIVTKAMAYFESQGFLYTLNPGKPMRSVHEFIFESKRGFCGHYASVFAVMMRLAGLPTRVVVGYQGGTYNASANYWIVRQQHAHAWTEVFFDNRGWVRVDPVSVVMPERINQGESLFNFAHQSVVSKSIEALRLFFDGLNYKWERYFQFKDGEAPGFVGGSEKPWLDAEMKNRLSFLLPLLVLALVLAKRRKLSSDDVAEEALQTYRNFCSKLSRKGLPRQLYEGPMDYALRLGSHFPQSAAEIRITLEIYARLRYGACINTRKELKMFRIKISRLLLRN